MMVSKAEQANVDKNPSQESLAEAIEEVLRLWIDSKDGIVTRKSIDTIADKHRVSAKKLAASWQDFLTAVVASSRVRET